MTERFISTKGITLAQRLPNSTTISKINVFFRSQATSAQLQISKATRPTSDRSLDITDQAQQPKAQKFKLPTGHTRQIEQTQLLKQTASQVVAEDGGAVQVALKSCLITAPIPSSTGLVASLDKGLHSYKRVRILKKHSAGCLGNFLSIVKFLRMSQ